MKEFTERDVPLPFPIWVDMATDSEPEAAPRRKTPERRLVWWWMRLLQGCLKATASADLPVDELPVDELELSNQTGKDGLLKGPCNESS